MGSNPTSAANAMKVLLAFIYKSVTTNALCLVTAVAFGILKWKQAWVESIRQNLGL